MNEKIKHCPFCGCKSVVCEKCKSIGKTCNTPAKAIDAWNRRVNEQEA